MAIGGVPEDFKELLEHRLETIGGAPVSVGSLLVGAAIVLFAVLFANLLAFSTRRFLRVRGAEVGAQFALAKIVRYSVISLGLLIGTNTMGLRLDALLAASAVLAVGIGFGLQNIAQNFVSGLILLVERPVRHGDFIRVGNHYGTVDDIGLRATHIITRDEVTMIIPNSALVTAEVVNHSRPTTNLRIRVNVGVAYGTDTAKVKRVLLGVARDESTVLDTPAAEVRLEDFADSQMNFSLLCWIGHAKDDLRTSSTLRFAIEAAFRKEGIEIPFPQREIRQRS
ncbi:MAG: mechanosensitive ion channel family protein [Polyangiaceae bacterium]